MGKLLDIYLSYDQLKELLENGESIKQNENGYNALHAAVLMTVDTHRKIKLLIDGGVDINAKDCRTPYQNTPLHILMVNENKDTSLYFIKLAADKIDYRVTDSEGKTTLILATKINAGEIALELIERIDSNLSILNMQDTDGMSALHYACLYGNRELAETLIAHGASTTLTNKDGKTPIDCVALGEEKIKQTLLSVSINPDRDEKAQFNNFKDRQFQPLMPIIRGTNKPQIVELPVKKENIQSLNEILKNYHLVDSVALSQSKFELMPENEKRFIQQQGAILTGVPLSKSLVNAANKLKQILLTKGQYSDWLLRMEASNGNESAVIMLIKNCKDRVNEFGLPSKRTAMHQAAIKGHTNICKLLLSSGADINALDNHDDTPLLLAIAYKHFDLAKELVMVGADIGYRNKNGDNALSLLTKLGQNQLKQELIQLQRGYEESIQLQDQTANLSEMRI